MFTGRKSELLQLDESYKSQRSQIITIYGRRRIGKSELIQHYAFGKSALLFEALEKEKSPQQITHFKEQLAEKLKDPILKKAHVTDWKTLFDYITNYLSKRNKKTILFFDEFQWMAAGQSKLVSLIKFYWDNHWKQFPVQLVLCGSISSYMVGKVIKSKALYGRIDLQLRIDDLAPNEIADLLGSKIAHEEVLRYMLLFGGVPKYFELIQNKLTFEQNIENLCFSKNSFFLEEFGRVFYSQFKKHRLHEKIVILISKGPLTLEEISNKLNITSSGGLKRYLTELELARFIATSNDTMSGKQKKYRLIDEYLRFYFHYIYPNLKLISDGKISNIFANKVRPKWSSWLGIAFENFCFKNIQLICQTLRIEKTLVDFFPLIQTTLKGGLQIDLVLKTSDKSLFICECKYHEVAIGLSVIAELENKLKFFKIPRGFSIKKVLIAPRGITKDLEKTNYFDSILKIEDLFYKH
jgi:AAA+ ATPase superfamily predicted ATPase